MKPNFLGVLCEYEVCYSSSISHWKERKGTSCVRGTIHLLFREVIIFHNRYLLPMLVFYESAHIHMHKHIHTYSPPTRTSQIE